MTIDTRQPALRMMWEEDDLVLSLAPLQGRWTEEQYLLLTDQTNRLLEFTDGAMEVLPMPTDRHQVIVRFLFLALLGVVHQMGGTVLFAPLRVRIRPRKFREPDILLLLDAHDPRRQNRYWLGADIAVEIISADDPKRDTHEKRIDYAEAGIPEYWIVDPEAEIITVLKLEQQVYSEHGIFARGDTATSALLPDIAVRVNDVFDAR